MLVVFCDVYSIDFYLSMGAVPMEEWTVYRITGERLQQLGGA